MPYFSYVMVCYNNWNFTRNAVDSFFESLNRMHQEKGIELVLVNNGSSDGTSAGIEKYKEEYKEVADIIPLQLEENLGYIAGVNIGFSRSRGEIITILNNDLIFCPGWFDGLAGILENHQEVGAAGPYITNGSGQENVILEFKTPELKEGFYRSKNTLNHYAQKIMEKNHDLVVCSNRVVGACVAIKREVLELVGGLDYWFGLGIFDDDDFTLRINMAGYKTVIVGRSFVYHEGNATFSKDRSLSNAAVLSNKMKFIYKWKIRCQENLEGHYNSREDVISYTPYIREENFIPISLEQYKPTLESTAHRGITNRVLMIADWTNFKSRWLQKLESMLLRKDASEEVYLWIPDKYFSRNDLSDIKNRIDILCRNKSLDMNMVVKFDCRHINAVGLIEYISSFDEVLSVEDDFVNRYIIYLAKQAGIAVK